MSNTIHIHPDVHAAMLKRGDIIVAGEGLPTTLIEGKEYVIDKYVPAMMRKQVRKPRSKKKRIQNKWAANPRNWEDVNVAYLVDKSKPFIRPKAIDLFQEFNLYQDVRTTGTCLGLDRSQHPSATITGVKGV